MNGDLVVGALLLTWGTRPRVILSSRPIIEGSGLLLTVVTLGLLVFTRSLATDIIDFSYLIFPVLIWAALRFGPPGASAATAVVSSLAIWGTAHGGGPFVGGTFHESVLALQTFMSIVAGTVLVLAAVVAERKRAEDHLTAALRDKEVLLQEVHHRVKNNLQVISSLLSLQADYIKDPRGQAMFAACGYRIHSMALIYHSLYQSESMAQIDFGAFLQALSRDLFHAYAIDAERIRLVASVDNIVLTIDTAVPCALLAHELISNCLKHAFPHGQAGQIGVMFRRQPDGKLQLQVRDDGVGLPEAVSPHTVESFGLQLVDIIREQLRATLELQRHPGTTVTITFAELTHQTKSESH
jgi:two-component sensor histidine kinase